LRVALPLALLALLPSLPPLGPRLFEMEGLEPGEVVGVAGVEVLVRFRAPERVESSTLRVLLNGGDITGDFTTGENGAYGRVSGLIDGENVLRIEVFGRSVWLPGMLFEQTREVRFRSRRPLDFDRA
jgi:hypothetical protein